MAVATEIDSALERKIDDLVTAKFNALVEAHQDLPRAGKEVPPNGKSGPKRLAIVASKGTLDMAYPPLILATTAGAMGWEVAIFFTFYGLDILNRKKLKHLKVPSLANPAMPVPVPNILGVLPGMTATATLMMKQWMGEARMPSIESLLETAKKQGVQLISCTTTMGVMKVKPEDLIPEAACGGAAAFLDFASEADVTLFI